MPLKYIIVGEGSSDIYSLEIICNRIAEEISVELEFDKRNSEPVTGPIGIDALKVRLMPTIFAERYIATCFSDVDANTFNGKIHKLKEWAQVARPDAADTRIACGAPDRNLEAWLIADEDCVKNILGLPGDKSLPFPEEDDPKLKLERLVTEYGDDSLSLVNMRKKLAAQMNFRIVRQKNRSFKKFSEEFIRVLRENVNN